MFPRCCNKLAKIADFRHICATGNKNSYFHIISLQPIQLMTTVMASSSAAQHRCRRLDGKVAVVTASTAGFAFCFVQAMVYVRRSIECVSIQDGCLSTP